MDSIATYFNDLAEKWEQELCTPSIVQPTVARIAGVRPDSRVLDVACGTGTMEEVYLQMGVRDVVALDIAPRMIEIARQKYAHEPSLSFMCQDVLAYESPEQFDAVVIYNAYPHFLDKIALSKHIAKLTKHGGRFIVAHGMSKETLNAHHVGMSKELTSDLCSPEVEMAPWEEDFIIDSVVDSPTFYCFAGRRR